MMDGCLVHPLQVKAICGLGGKFYSREVGILLAALGVVLSGASVRRAMVLAGVARPRGGPKRWSVTHPLALAGTQLLLAADPEIGAIAGLTADLRRALHTLPKLDGVARDDRANRDDHGRFLSSYNVGQERGGRRLRFELVDQPPPTAGGGYDAAA